MPRFVFQMKATKMAEGPMTTTPEEGFNVMMKFNEEMHAAGIFLGGEGLVPSSQDAYRLSFPSPGPPEVKPGPFDVEGENHVCGWWIVEVKNAEEALSWAKKIPTRCGEIFVRKIADGCSSGEGFPEGFVEKEKKLRLEIAKRNLELAEKVAEKEG